MLTLLKSKRTVGLAIFLATMGVVGVASAAPGDYISGDPSDGAIADFAADVAAFALTVVLPAVLIALAAGAALRLIFKAVRKVTSSVG